MINVKYFSDWDEGLVESTAVLNKETGEVTDITSSNEGINYEYHNYDYIELNDGTIFNITSSNEFNYCINKEDLSELQ